MKTLVKIIVTAIAVMITQYLLPGVKVDVFTTALLVAVVLTVLNNLLRPVLIILTIPITFFTFGFFLLVINTGMILLTSHIINHFRPDGFMVNGFWSAFLFSIILSIVTAILQSFDKKDKRGN